MRELKAEWWELWWVKDGERPVCIPMYGESILHSIPPSWISIKTRCVRGKELRHNKRLYAAKNNSREEIRKEKACKTHDAR